MQVWNFTIGVKKGFFRSLRDFGMVFEKWVKEFWYNNIFYKVWGFSSRGLVMVHQNTV